MKRILPIVAIFLLFGAAAGLAAQSSSDGKSDIPPFVVVFPRSVIGFNPIHAFTSTEAQLYTALYEGLVTYNPLNLDPLPGVAESWDVTNNGTVYTFHLRKDAVFWNGEPVTAQDFRNTWLKVLDPKVKAEYSFLLDSVVGAKAFRLGESSDPDTVGIKALSKDLLQVTLVHPATQFLKILCHYSFVPIPSNYLNIPDWRDQKVIPGNGPFYVVKHTADEIDLTKNNLYWDADNVDINEIKILLTDDAAKVTKMFDAGEIQWATGSVEWDKVHDQRSIMVNPLFATSYFFFKADKSPWDNPDVRRALALLLPWDKIRQDSPLYIPTSTLVPQIDSYPDVTGITKENNTEAMQLLVKAGYPGGKGLSTVTITIPTDAESKRIADIMAASWERALGLSVKINSVPYPEYYSRIEKGDYTLATTTWIGDFADPLTFLQMWTSDSNLNDGGYKNSAFDSKVHSSMSEKEPERYKTLADAESILLNGAEVLPIDHSPALNLVKVADIQGWFPNALDIHPFKYLRYRTPSPIPGVAETRPSSATEAGQGTS
ncbi:MAG TPA: peptide ABC transporter substrate-binding protein [Spirochaetia bacterium]|nr:peptide ABC transporter substrate-binding protein [Spirochaetia bacterium]